MQKKTQKKSPHKNRVDSLVDSIIREMAHRREGVGKKKHGLRFLKITLNELEQEAVQELIDYLNWSVLQVANVLVSRIIFREALEKIRGGLLDD